MIKSVTIHPSEFLEKRLGPDFGGISLEFSPGPNLIIGPNGSGKSTIFKALRAVLQGVSDDSRGSWTSGDFSPGTVEVTIGNGKILRNGIDKPVEHAIFHDGIMDNRALAPMITYQSVELQLSAMRSSHGQGLVIQVGHAIDSAIKTRSTLCLDEPDGSLDLNTIKTLSKMDVLHSKTGIQTIVISHHPIMLLRGLRHGWRIFETARGYAVEACHLMEWPENIVKECSRVIFLRFPTKVGDGTPDTH